MRADYRPHWSRWVIATFVCVPLAPLPEILFIGMTSILIERFQWMFDAWLWALSALFVFLVPLIVITAAILFALYIKFDIRSLPVYLMVGFLMPVIPLLLIVVLWGADIWQVWLPHSLSGLIVGMTAWFIVWGPALKES